MAMFCYTCESEGKTIEVPFSCGAAPWVIQRDGKLYARDIAAEWKDRKPPPKAKGSGKIWQRSISNGIVGDSGTLQQAMQLDRQLGVPINYHAERPGVWSAEFEGREHKNKWLKAHKRVDYDAGYGDPVPGDFRKTLPGEFEK